MLWILGLICILFSSVYSLCSPQIHTTNCLISENQKHIKISINFNKWLSEILHFPSGSVEKNLPAMQETRVQPLGWEDPLEKTWQPTPVFLPGEVHGQKSLEAYSPRGRRVRRDWAARQEQHPNFYTHKI